MKIFKAHPLAKNMFLMEGKKLGLLLVEHMLTRTRPWVRSSARFEERTGIYRWQKVMWRVDTCQMPSADQKQGGTVRHTLWLTNAQNTGCT